MFRATATRPSWSSSASGERIYLPPEGFDAEAASDSAYQSSDSPYQSAYDSPYQSVQTDDAVQGWSRLPRYLIAHPEPVATFASSGKRSIVVRLRSEPRGRTRRARRDSPAGSNVVLDRRRQR